MKRLVLGLLCGCLLCGAASAKQPPLKLLYLGLSKGFAHSSVGPAGQAVTELGEQTGLWTTKVSADIADLAPAAIGQWDIILFYTTGDLGFDDATKQGLLDWIQAGGGFGGFHSATDTYYNWPEYGKLLGGYFAGHPWNQVAGFTVEEPDHPIIWRLAPSFDFLEEIYVFRDFERDAQKVLVSLDNSSVDAAQGAGARPDLYFANLWCKDVGQGRMVYNGFGHHDGAFADPRMRQVIVDMVTWLAKLDWQTDPAITDKVKANDVAGLVALAGSQPLALREQPVLALGGIDTEAAGTQLKALAAANQPLDLRVAAVRAMGRSPRVRVADLQPLLGDGSQEVRRAALLAIARHGDQAASVALLSALEAPSEDVRNLALQLLTKVDDPRVTDILLAKLASDDDANLRTALSGLAKVHNDAVAGALLAAVLRDSAATRAVLPTLIDRLATYPPTEERLALYRAGLASDRGDVRTAALKALIAAKRPESLALVAPLLFDHDAAVAQAATQAVAGLPAEQLSAYLTPYISQWLVVGPFDRDRDKDFGPETNLNVAATYTGQTGQVGWKPTTVKANGLLDFREAIASRDNCLGYAWAVIESPAETTVQLRLGSDDGVKAWLNGEQVLAVAGDRAYGADSDRVTVKLKQGRNDLLCKVDQGGGDWSLAVRLGSSGGQAAGLRFALPQ